MQIIKSLIKKAKHLFTPVSYGDELQEYIIKKNPKTVNDVENFTFQYQRSQSKEVWL